MATLNNKIAEKENINVLNKKMAELGDVQKRIGSYLVDTSQIDTFVGYLEEMGADNNIDLSVKSVEVPKNEKNKISLSIDIRGSFENILKGISLLENAPYNISVTSLFLNKDMTENESDQNIFLETTPAKTKEVFTPAKSVWQANLSFNVLSL
ncbi:hypothetical protein A2467_01685 [Candidatus Nomurabacteria bacterium RIFOXYC2_FULL_36_8]|nr:MAG: hypothetical protein A2467_01685 [Candidatus Nomurabacteria bacterium RIFOXYC2_FULL_36_8]